MTHIAIISTPTGNLKLCATDDELTYCNWTQEKNVSEKKSPVLQEACGQLRLYFQRKLQNFDLPLNPEGTVFQKRVWDALLTIPYGETYSYQTIARIIEQPNAVRAVGNANGKNPLCIFIPCHRVIYASGKIGGYSAGLGHKEKLLAIESHK
ncbi:MAG: methylated-DNA--[protein]-cysteine S-methyltransferase [Coxiellaceae bacterium]|nr:methylated-DNA--[protein]-cysteine S-methyltransferase [Coxiellaceae bacterium]